MLEFRVFVECQQNDGYGNSFWQEVSSETGFLDGYCSAFDGYVTDELFIGLSALRDGYYSNLLKRAMPKNLSTTISYKLEMLSFLGNTSKYYLMLDEINNFNWNRKIYSSELVNATTFADVAPDFVATLLPGLQSLGSPSQVRLIIIKLG
jgi:hypothetical protein